MGCSLGILHPGTSPQDTELGKGYVGSGVSSWLRPDEASSSPGWVVKGDSVSQGRAWVSFSAGHVYPVLLRLELLEALIAWAPAPCVSKLLRKMFSIEVRHSAGLLDREEKNSERTF